MSDQISLNLNDANCCGSLWVFSMLLFMHQSDGGGAFTDRSSSLHLSLVIKSQVSCHACFPSVCFWSKMLIMVVGHSFWVFSMSVLMLMMVEKDAFNRSGSLWLVSMTTPQGGAFTDPDFILEYMRMCPAKFWGVIKSHGALKMKTVVAACFPSVASCSSGGDALANPYIAKLWWFFHLGEDSHQLGHQRSADT